jgi:hypothetical protein
LPRVPKINKITRMTVTPSARSEPPSGAKA